MTRKYILIFPMGQIVNPYLEIKKDKKFPIQIDSFLGIGQGC